MLAGLGASRETLGLLRRMTHGLEIYRAIAGLEYRHNTPDSESRTPRAALRSPCRRRVVETKVEELAPPGVASVGARGSPAHGAA